MFNYIRHSTQYLPNAGRFARENGDPCGDEDVPNVGRPQMVGVDFKSVERLLLKVDVLSGSGRRDAFRKDDVHCCGVRDSCTKIQYVFLIHIAIGEKNIPRRGTI